MNACRPLFQLMLPLATLLLLLATLWKPVYPQEQWLQQLPTVLALVGLLLSARRGWLSNASASCLTAMLALHILGARWVYSYVPYESLCDAWFGSGPYEWFGWGRNHYDRLVHFAFGLLVTYPLAEAAVRKCRLTTMMALAFAWIAIAALSALYEVAEWLLAVIAAPEMAERYNGQQGDFWDAQKDMALAMAGSTITVVGVALTVRRGKGGESNG